MRMCMMGNTVFQVPIEPESARYQAASRGAIERCCWDRRSRAIDERLKHDGQIEHQSSSGSKEISVLY
jgi:hypothetical protein